MMDIKVCLIVWGKYLEIFLENVSEVKMEYVKEDKENELLVLFSDGKGDRFSMSEVFSFDIVSRSPF